VTSHEYPPEKAAELAFRWKVYNIQYPFSIPSILLAAMDRLLSVPRIFAPTMFRMEAPLKCSVKEIIRELLGEDLGVAF